MNKTIKQTLIATVCGLALLATLSLVMGASFSGLPTTGQSGTVVSSAADGVAAGADTSSSWTNYIANGTAWAQHTFVPVPAGRFMSIQFNGQMYKGTAAGGPNNSTNTIAIGASVDGTIAGLTTNWWSWAVPMNTNLTTLTTNLEIAALPYVCVVSITCLSSNSTSGLTNYSIKMNFK